MTNLYYVYAILDTRFPNNCDYKNYHFDYTPFYIGKGKGNRFEYHFYESRLKDTNKLKVNIINKIVLDNKEPMVIILESNLSESDAFKLEIELIKLIGRRDIKTGTLANLTDGGEGQSGNTKSFILENNPFYGKKHKKESYQKVSKPVNQYTLDNVFIKSYDSIQEASIQTNSIDTKISLCARGIRNTHNGYKWSFLNESDINNDNKSYTKVKFKYVEKIDINTGEVVDTYKTVTQAANSVGATSQKLAGCLSGKRRTAYGFKWRYII